MQSYSLLQLSTAFYSLLRHELTPLHSPLRSPPLSALPSLLRGPTQLDVSGRLDRCLARGAGPPGLARARRRRLKGAVRRRISGDLLAGTACDYWALTRIAWRTKVPTRSGRAL